MTADLCVVVDQQHVSSNKGIVLVNGGKSTTPTLRPISPIFVKEMYTTTLENVDEYCDDKNKMVVNEGERSLPAAAMITSLPITTTTITRTKKDSADVTQVGGGSKAEKWTKLQNLKELYEQGFLTVTEYKERKGQLVDCLTGTTITTESRCGSTTRGNSNSKAWRQPSTFIASPPPDFSSLAEESAIKHTFDNKTGLWSESHVKVKLDGEPFARGGLRKAYHLLDSEHTDSSISYVGKMSIEVSSEKDQYFHDVEMQMYVRQWAELFNACVPPKKVDFVAAWLLTLLDRSDAPLCAVERFIEGPYRKHNNNYGYVNEDERNTPQAFSHFTYEASQHTALVCDIQGVGDLYTDPQLHTIDQVGFGKGNLGPRGFSKFLQTHRCNAICRYLRLPPINAKPLDSDVGTMPATRFMAFQNYSHINVNVHAPPHVAAQHHLSDNPTSPLLCNKSRMKSEVSCCIIL